MAQDTPLPFVSSSNVPTATPVQTPSTTPTTTPSVFPSFAPTSLRVIPVDTTTGNTVNVDVPFDEIFGSGTSLDPNSFEIIQRPLNGNATIEDNGSVMYTPNPKFQGNDEFTATACDIDSNCVALSFALTVAKKSDDGSNRKDALYALIALILAPILWFFQEPLKRAYDRCFPQPSKNDGVSTTAGSSIPTSVHVDADPTSNVSDNDNGEDEFNDEEDPDDDEDESDEDEDEYEEDSGSDDESYDTDEWGENGNV